MPRQVFDIEKFNNGIISAVDAEDLPPESASDSLNVDGDAGEGKLQGIPTDVVFEAPTGSALTNVKLGEFIEENGIYDFIYHDQSANTISVIVDFYDTNSTKKKLNIISSLTSDNVTITKNNKEVRIGIDGNYAYWIGKINHGLFNNGMSWAIASIANSGGEVQITTTPTHPIKDGDIIKISGATGTDSASINGVWVAKSCNNFAKTFVLTGSAFTGTTLTLTGTAEFYIIYEYAHCQRNYGNTEGLFTLSSVSGYHNATPGYFKANIRYAFAITWIYDGIEESPIGNSTNALCTVESDYIPMDIIAFYATPTVTNTTGLGSFNKRITGINLYRAESSDDDIANIGLFRLVASIDINTAVWSVQSIVHSKTTINDYGTYYTLGVVATTYPSNPVTYTENSGMPETLIDPIVYYGLSTMGNGYLFAGKSAQPTLNGSETRYIYKSKQSRYDMFDYYSDFLVMPEPITALHFYDGKLWATSLNKIYRINPDGMYIEDVFEDAGCQGQRAIHSNEYGMFFGNFQSAWMYRDGSFSKISDAIRQSTTSGKSWETFYKTTLTDLIITSDSKKGYILFINERSSSGAKLFAWAYHPARKRWDAFSFADYASSANAGVFKGKDGEVYLSYGTATQKLMRNTGFQLWEWYSQELPNSNVRQKKSFTMIKIDTTGTVTINYGVDGATPATAYTNEALINAYNKSMKIKLNAASGSNSVDSLELVYRDLVGAR